MRDELLLAEIIIHKVLNFNYMIVAIRQTKVRFPHSLSCMFTVPRFSKVLILRMQTALRPFFLVGDRGPKEKCSKWIPTHVRLPNSNGNFSIQITLIGK